MVSDKQFGQATKDWINLMGLGWDSGCDAPRGCRSHDSRIELFIACFVKPWQCVVHMSLGCVPASHASAIF